MYHGSWLYLSTILLLNIYVYLSKYFVAVNAGAVPKKILEIMDVEGLTRENVASHLQVWFILLCSITMLVFLSTILLLKILG